MLGEASTLLDLAQTALRAKRGDPAARQRLAREGAPLLADMYRPGLGALVARGLTLFDEYRATTAAPPVVDAEYTELAEDVRRLPDWSPFVLKLFRRRFGFYTAFGEPGSGKTTLLLKIAQRLHQEHGYAVSAVGGLHPDDRTRWRTDAWVDFEPRDAFIDAMDAVAEAMEAGGEYPAGLKRRVLLLDDASLSAGVGAVRANRALQAAWSHYRHLDWVILLSSRTFKTVAMVAEGADVRFLKRPRDWEDLEAVERTDVLHLWRRAERAYQELRRTDDWAENPDERCWAYADAPELRWKGLVQYGGPEDA